MLNEELKIAVKASIQAGKEIIKVYEGDFSHELKDDRTPLTLADKNANEVINFFLSQTNFPIISEENKQIDYSLRKDWNYCWIVDPLDGTKEFIKRNNEFTVNIALVNGDGNPVLGVIYVPVDKIIYFANVKEHKLHKYKLSKIDESIDKIFNDAELIDNSKKSDDVIRVVGSRSHMNKKTQNFINSLKTPTNKVKLISRGSSLKFCLVAERKADVYPRFAPTMEWDTAAAHAICNAVGISIKSIETNKELTYNKENLLNPWFICK